MIDIIIITPTSGNCYAIEYDNTTSIIEYQLSCTNWQDDKIDEPFKYSFAYRDISVNSQIV